MEEACRNGDTDALRRNLADREEYFGSGFNAGLPLHICASLGNLECLRVLTEEGGVNVDAKNKGGLTAADLAAQAGHLDSLKYLVDHGATITREGDGEASFSTIARAMKGGSLECVRYLAEECNCELSAGARETAANLAASAGSVELLRYLKNSGVDMNAGNWKGKMPIHHAASGEPGLPSSAIAGRLACLRLLVEEFGVDVNQKVSFGGSYPLHYAWTVDTVQYLCDKGADVNARSAGITTWKQEVDEFAGETPAGAAAGIRRVDLLKCLRENGADLTIVDNAGMSGLDDVKNQRAKLAKDAAARDEFYSNPQEGLDVGAVRRREERLRALGLSIEDKIAQADECIAYLTSLPEFAGASP